MRRLSLLAAAVTTPAAAASLAATVGGVARDDWLVVLALSACGGATDIAQSRLSRLRDAAQADAEPMARGVAVSALQIFLAVMAGAAAFAASEWGKSLTGWGQMLAIYFAAYGGVKSIEALRVKLGGKTS